MEKLNKGQYAMKPQTLEIIYSPAANIVLAIVGLAVINSTFVILLGICANVGLTFFKCPAIANT